MTNPHPAERREKLRLAGLSEASELTAAQTARADAMPLTEAKAHNERWVRERIWNEQPEPKPKPKRKSKPKPERQPRKASIGDEAIKLLAERGPMHYRDLAEALIAGGKVKTKGKTFAQTLSADLARRNGRGVNRVAPGVYEAAIDVSNPTNPDEGNPT